MCKMNMRSCWRIAYANSMFVCHFGTSHFQNLKITWEIPPTHTFIKEYKTYEKLQRSNCVYMNDDIQNEETESCGVEAPQGRLPYTQTQIANHKTFEQFLKSIMKLSRSTKGQRLDWQSADVQSKYFRLQYSRVLGTRPHGTDEYETRWHETKRKRMLIFICIIEHHFIHFHHAVGCDVREGT